MEAQPQPLTAEKDWEQSMRRAFQRMDRLGLAGTLISIAVLASVLWYLFRYQSFALQEMSVAQFLTGLLFLVIIVFVGIHVWVRHTVKLGYEREAEAYWNRHPEKRPVARQS